ncbi:MAG: FAD-dependent oxidoreductase [Oscillospiraceae bacterium]|jgi:2,4-dienoyl-CoA reductase-like NADH-dependent reductase (Old Yellow Enzyme family)/thioredoxin reductase
MHKKYPHVFQPLKLRGLVLKNRIFAAPTSMDPAGPDETYGFENYDYYKLRASGGAAMVTIGEVMVDLANGRSHRTQASINDAKSWSGFARMADAIHSQGAACSVELDHGGALSLQDLIGHVAKGPSAYIDPWGEQVEEMTEEEIYEAAEKYAEAAANAKRLGFDMVMLHGGHGWLIHQFLSPLTNFRTDNWGGTPEKRMNFMLLVVDKVREAVGGNFPIDIRISGSERTEGGYGLDYGIEIAKALDGKVDLIHVSAGTQQVPYSAVLMHPSPFEKDMENAGLAAEIKKHVKTPVCTVGAFNVPEDMENYLAQTGVDGISLGRALIADPFLPKKMLRGQEDKITYCLRCTDCLSGLMKNGQFRCAVNPYIGREGDYFHPALTRIKRKVLIAGGGPGGMQAALEAYERGHEVVLCEAGPKLGGALKFADSGADFKKPVLRYREQQAKKVMELPIDVRLNTVVDQSVVDEVKPDVLIAAVGADPLVLPLPGADGDNVIIGADIMPDTPVGDKVVVIGGGFIGCEEAVLLAREGKDVTIVEMLDELAVESGFMYRLSLLHQVEASGVKTATGLKCTRITKEGVYALDKDNNELFFPADSVVMAAGMRPRYEEVERLRPLCGEFYAVGNCVKAGTIMKATRDGFDAAVNMGL